MGRIGESATGRMGDSAGAANRPFADSPTRRLASLRRLVDSPTRRFPSLRARLTLAFVFIILVTLFLAGSAFVFILRDYQIRQETDRVAGLAAPLSNQVRSLEQLGATRDEIVTYLERQAEELELRVVLADSRGRVLVDSEDTLVGRQLQIQASGRFGPQRRARQASIQTAEGEISFMVSAALGPAAQSAANTPPAAGSGSLGERLPGRLGAYVVGLSIPRHSLGAAWLELLPRLSVAALAALLLSIAVAWPLASSIARPLAGMTTAAEDIARGRMEQEIPVRGHDEVGRLARAFNKMARDVDASQQTLRDFIANVSHDLRTPLTSIRGFSLALTDGTLRDKTEVAAAGRVIDQEAARMSHLVDDLLYLSKIESGQSPLEGRELHLKPLVASRIDAAARRVVEAGVELRWLPHTAPRVMADPARLERVIDNLLDNALSYTPRGGVVTVRLGQASAVRRPPSAVLSVHNTGSTIPPPDLPRVFERFYQVDKSRAAGSSGLGLAITREIVLAHGGRCWAQSSPQTGTEFFVELPAVNTAQSTLETTTQERGRTAAVRAHSTRPSEANYA